ncbi:AMP-binding protein [Rhodoligotrophos defluvii]|uniref:AMP-binding protein n=1 Tax=Rhodoligotrophos defluvii TaxID=2561934 RepID=UPI001484D102|nr:AMP-binding protein [Rhodoligotrophos defluvii]
MLSAAPEARPIWQLIEHQSALRGNAVFLRFAGRELTYGSLAERVRTAAAALRARGLEPHQRVLVMMPNHPEHVVVYLALAWIGCVIIEVSIHLKRSGIQLQIEDAKPHAIIVDQAFLTETQSALAMAGVRLPVLVRDAEPGLRSHDSALDITNGRGRPEHPEERSLDAVHAISYTSGTTGRPKGVVMTERFFQVGAKNAGILADVRPSDILFLWEPFYHVAGWMSVLISLQHGVPIAMVERFSATQCWQQIRESGATLFHYLGGAMNLLLKQPPRPDDADNPVRIAWGAAAPAGSWRAFERRFGVTVREGYGISEAQNFTHMNLEGRVGSIGVPVEEFDAWIADEAGRRAGPDEIGEIVVKPKDPRVIMRGYFRDDAKTGEVLRDGCVHTGDLGYVDREGYFYYAGRKKDSLRRRGENVSAWEVERVINAHPAVSESAVIGVPSEMGEQDIRAFVKLADGMAAAPLDLVRWCEKHLAYYQIPRYIDFVDDFPRGPTQRIRKDELPAGTAAAWDLEQSGYKLTRM